MTTKKLFIDETGLISGNYGYYILIGCVIRNSKRKDLEIFSGQIKYKYWNRDDLVFHSQEIGKRIGAFKILRNDTIREDFYTDLFKLLKLAPVILFPVVLDKRKISKRKWGRKRRLKTICRNLLRNFILLTIATRGCRGKIVIESSSLDQDYYYHEALNHFKTNGVKNLQIQGGEVSSRITSLAFVNKLNGDIEEQLADIFAYGVKCRMENKNFKKGSYEARLIKILDKKLFQFPATVKGHKRKLLSNIKKIVLIQ
jgi:hypothetical protein